MTAAPAFAILALPHDQESEPMRAVLFHAGLKPNQGQSNWSQFVREIQKLGPPPAMADRLTEEVWLLPLPQCQVFVDQLKQLVFSAHLAISARTLPVDFHPPSQTVT